MVDGDAKLEQFFEDEYSSNLIAKHVNSWPWYYLIFPYVNNFLFSKWISIVFYVSYVFVGIDLYMVDVL